MKNKNLTIVYSCNDAMFEGLYLSILSMLNRTKSTINFYCLTGDLSNIKKNYLALTKKHEKILNELVKKFNNKNSFKTIDCTKLYLNAFKGSKRLNIVKYTPYTMFRLLMEDMKVLKGVILYIDIDTMINGDISEAFNVDIKNYDLCACHDRNFGRRCHRKYFNAGVMLLNLTKIRKTHYLKRALEYFKKRRPIMADQTALNRVYPEITFWPNEFRFNYQKPNIEENTIIKHFLYAPRVNQKIKHIKQWHINKVQNILNIHYWDKDYAYFLSQKKLWDKK